MQIVSAQQVKAARALLSWKQEDLAEAACVSVTAVRNFEIGCAPRASTAVAICKAIKDAGIEFIESDGVRRGNPEIKVYRGPDSCNELFKDIRHTVKSQDGGVFMLVKEHQTLVQASGVPLRSNLQRLMLISDEISAKCLLPDVLEASLPSSEIEFRVGFDEFPWPHSVIVYGNKYAYLIPERRQDFLILTFNIITVALSYRELFLSLWKQSEPVLDRRAVKTNR